MAFCSGGGAVGATSFNPYDRPNSSLPVSTGVAEGLLGKQGAGAFESSTVLLESEAEQVPSVDIQRAPAGPSPQGNIVIPSPTMHNQKRLLSRLVAKRGNVAPRAIATIRLTSANFVGMSFAELVEFEKRGHTWAVRIELNDGAIKLPLAEWLTELVFLMFQPHFGIVNSKRGDTIMSSILYDQIANVAGKIFGLCLVHSAPLPTNAPFEMFVGSSEFGAGLYLILPEWETRSGLSALDLVLFAKSLLPPAPKFTPRFTEFPIHDPDLPHPFTPALTILGLEQWMQVARAPYMLKNCREEFSGTYPISLPVATDCVTSIDSLRKIESAFLVEFFQGSLLSPMEMSLYVLSDIYKRLSLDEEFSCLCRRIESISRHIVTGFMKNMNLDIHTSSSLSGNPLTFQLPHTGLIDTTLFECTLRNNVLLLTSPQDLNDDATKFTKRLISYIKLWISVAYGNLMSDRESVESSIKRFCGSDVIRFVHLEEFLCAVESQTIWNVCPEILSYRLKRGIIRKEILKHFVFPEPLNLLELNRTSIFEESHKIIKDKEARQMLENVFVSFHGEFGMDIGALAREWFNLVLHDVTSTLSPTASSISDASNGSASSSQSDEVSGRKPMFIEVSKQTKVMMPNPAWEGPMDYFVTVGKIIGLVVYYGETVGERFSFAVYMKILGLEPTFTSLWTEFCRENPEGCASYTSLKETPDDQLGDIVFGLTRENVEEYIATEIKSVFSDSVKIQLEKIREGIHFIIPKKFLDVFHLKEFIEGIEGKFEPVTGADIVKIVKFAEEVPVMVREWFSNTVRRFTGEEARRFLELTTDTPVLPVPSSDGKLTVDVFTWLKVERLPTVVAGGFTLGLPNYTTFAMLEKKLKQAINEGRMSLAGLGSARA